MATGKVNWARERWRDLLMWPRNLLRDWPRRAQRLGQVRGGMHCAIALVPQQSPRLGRAVSVHAWAAFLFDAIGGPELAQYLMHLFMVTTPLTSEERAAIVSVLGPKAMRYDDIRIAEGGILPHIFRRNGGRAFCTWHTIHLQRDGAHTRKDLSLLVHEATHVMQYERMGTLYIGEALYAQRKLGRGAYDYGGEEGLRRARAAGTPLRAYNREAQAQMVQDYFRRREAGQDVAAYEPYLQEARAGAFG